MLLSRSMDIRTYRQTRGLTQTALANLLTNAGFPAEQSLVSQWERNVLPVSADWCVRLELVSKGECRRVDIRPDLFGELKQPKRSRKAVNA